jgi:hypothetical protein
MSTGGLGAYPEHHFRKFIPGNIEGVRRRLCDVLEDFNYTVLSENPVQARRPPQRNVLAANILEYDTRLTVALKHISPVSTLATFDYAVPYIFSKADKLTLEREADAIIALANAPLRKSVCPTCATENAGAVRFCRVCGTPVARSTLPAELEVMRLMGDASASYIEIGWGMTIAVFTLALTLPMILLGNPKAVTAGWVLFAIGELIGLWMLAYGLLRLRRTLIASHGSQQEARPGVIKEISATGRMALPPQSVSITEGTTELMDSSKQPAPLPAKQARDTDAME